ncbi:MAG: phenylacetate--CoA ligase [bacterium]|nr:phenylacetate--CoA ligase [bacterium]
MSRARIDRDFHTRAELEAHQLELLRDLLAEIRGRNPFYAPILEAAGLTGELASLEQFRRSMPFTTKPQIATDQTRHPPYGTNLTYAPERYSRLHQTSSTTGQPMRWLDTPESWEALLDGWQHVLEAARVTAADRILFAAGFGPFIGFWLGFEAAARMGCLVVPGGAMDSSTRLRVMQANAITVVSCTPTYALHLAEVARSEGLDPASFAITKLIVAGEPGGSVPATRANLEAAWPGAHIYDHYGMTEIGPVTYQLDGRADVVNVVESSYLCEIVDRATGAPLEVGSDDLGELVLTSLRRKGSPLLRYRTGDLVRACPDPPRPGEPVTLQLAGGILAREYHMEVVRGVNLYPSAVDQVVRGVAGIAEYLVELDERGSMTKVRVRIEPDPAHPDPTEICTELESAFKKAWSLRIPVEATEPGALPRYDLKARRWIKLQ